MTTLNSPPTPIPSPLPPLRGHLEAELEVLCRYCKQVSLIISKERISDDITTGRIRYRHVPRDLQGNFHDCRNIHDRYHRTTTK